jgi:hypothetical protein
MVVVRLVECEGENIPGYGSGLSEVAIILRGEYTEHNIGDLYINISDKELGLRSEGFYIVGDDSKIQELDYDIYTYGSLHKTFYTFTRFELNYFNLNTAEYINLTDSPIPKNLGSWYYNPIIIEPGIPFDIVDKRLHVHYDGKDYYFDEREGIVEGGGAPYDEPLEKIFKNGGMFLVEWYSDTLIMQRV